MAADFSAATRIIFNYMIQFIKTLPYDLAPKETDIFQYLTDLGLQNIDPPTISIKPLSVTADIILYSPLKRVSKTIVKNPELLYIESDSLKEILFNLQDFCSEEDYAKFKSHIVRKKFKQFFVENQLPIKREVIFSEIKSLLSLCNAYSDREIAVVSHSFRLKIIEAFIKTKGEIEHKPELIYEYLFDNKKTYEFGVGFIIHNESLGFLQRG